MAKYIKLLILIFGMDDGLVRFIDLTFYCC